MINNFDIRKILILAANPRDTLPLRLDEEVREIRSGLERSRRRDLFQIESRWAVRPKDLRRALLDLEPQIVHFCGHGAKGGGIYLENDMGQQQLAGAEALSGLFKLCSSHIKCVVLNACYSSAQAKLISQHINYVVGMNQAIGDEAAIEFAIGFYDSLGAGRKFEDAYEFGKNAISFADVSEYLVPVLNTKNIHEGKPLAEYWKNEAYVSLHLVQKLLENSGLHNRSMIASWYPEFRIKIDRHDNKGRLKPTQKFIDFLIEDKTRNLSFLIEVKSASSKIDDSARIQLKTYLQYSDMQFGFLIDPFMIEVWEWKNKQFAVRDKFTIKHPEETQPASDFIKNSLDIISYENNCSSCL